MRTLYPNLERDDALETVLEVPIPEEMFGYNNKHKPWHIVKSWVKNSGVQKAAAAVFGGRGAEIRLLLGVVGAPLIPLPIKNDLTVNDSIKGHPTENSIARYIVQQYIAAAGGEQALNSIDSMYAMGKVKMMASEFVPGEDSSLSGNSKVLKAKNMRHAAAAAAGGEIGGFVLWQKKPDMWSLELMVSGCKISAGSDGKIAWRQTPWQHSHASRGPARPVRRALQGLDPRSTANLFSTSICIGEKSVNDEDCFVLKLEADPSTLSARSSSNVEIMRHTVWGCFSQRTGLLVQLEDSHMLRMKAPFGGDTFWETSMESMIQDYRTIDGVNVAHSGKTCVSLFRFGQNKESHTRTRMEEVWSIEEVDFSVKGLSMDCFLPPADLKKEEEDSHILGEGEIKKKGGLGYKNLSNSFKITAAKSGSRVVAISEEDLEEFETEEELSM